MRKFNGPKGEAFADKIQEVTQNEQDVVTTDLARYGHSSEWRRQNNPQAGDYYVLENGQARVVAAGEFEKDYKPAEDTTFGTSSRSQRQAERDERAQKARDKPKTPEQARIEDREKQRQRDQDEAAQRAADRARREQRAEGLIQNVQARENAERESRDGQMLVPGQKANEEKQQQKQEQAQQRQPGSADRRPG